MRVLVTGWFSFAHGEATVGDVRAAEVVCGWLEEAGLPADLASSPVFGEGADLDEVDPSDYSDLVFVCGPAHGEQLEQLLARFAGCRRVGVDVSVTPGAQPPFDVLLERDSDRVNRPDLSIISAREPLPVVGVVRAHAQPEYGGAFDLDTAHAAVDELLDGAPAAPIELGTRVDPRELGRQTSAQLEAAIARTDAVVTTRLHGLVMALKGGVPALAIDPVRGGGKVTAQAHALGWPHVRGVDALDADDLAAALRACLEPQAREQAADCVRRARTELDDVRGELLRTLTAERPDAA